MRWLHAGAECTWGGKRAAGRHPQLQPLLHNALVSPVPGSSPKSIQGHFTSVGSLERNFRKRWHYWKGVAGVGRAWPWPGHLPILFQATDHSTPEQSFLRDQVPVQQQTDPMLDYCERYLQGGPHSGSPDGGPHIGAHPAACTHPQSQAARPLGDCTIVLLQSSVPWAPNRHKSRLWPQRQPPSLQP